MFNYKFKKVLANDNNIFVISSDDKLYSSGSNDFGERGWGYANYNKVFLPIDVNDVAQIACGSNHTFILKNDGSLWSCGLNFSGQLGLGIYHHLYYIRKLDVDNVKQIACGSNHTFILKNDGSVWSCGYNQYGQLGLNNTTDRSIFIQVTTNVEQIACGQYHTFILKNDGSLWSCGLNDSGQLGLGTSDNNAHSTFTQVTTNINNDVMQIACGSNHTIILKTDGSVWSCGRNYYGQLGLGDTTKRTTFTQVTTNISNDVTQIACGGYYHTIILKTDGSVWSCGRNYYGQLGLNDTTDRRTFTQVTTNINNDVMQIACGYNHTFILKNDGSIWACGYNNHGQLGLGDNATYRTFTQVITNINNDVKQVACGDSHTFILKTDCSAWSCGRNYHGQLGHINMLDCYVFSSLDINNIRTIKCGVEWIFIIDNENNLYGLGSNWNMNFGTSSYDGLYSITKLYENVEDVYIGNYCTFIKTIDGKILGTGANWSGQIGTGDTSGSDVETFTELNIDNINKILVADEDTFMLKNDGSLWVCGANYDGELGLNNSSTQYSITQVTTNINNDIKDIDCTYYHSAILKNDGTVWTCGWNYYGQLGLGDTNGRTTFTQVNITDVKKIICEEYHTIILKNDGTVWTCGRNNHGQLGLGNTTNYKTFTQVNITNVKEIYCNPYNTYLLTNDNKVYGCGLNNCGQLGCGVSELLIPSFVEIDKGNDYIINDIAIGLFSLIIIDEYENGYFCGLNNYGQMGASLGQMGTKVIIDNVTAYEKSDSFNNVDVIINNEIIKIKEFNSGNSHEILIADDAVFIMGSNNYGQLGLGDNNDREQPTKININNIKCASCGKYHTILLDNDGKLYVAGSNVNGELGLDSTVNTTNEFILSIDNVKHAKAIRGITVIEKDGKLMVTGEYIGNTFVEYEI